MIGSAVSHFRIDRTQPYGALGVETADELEVVVERRREEREETRRERVEKLDIVSY